MAWPAIKKFLTPAEFKAYVDTLDFSQWKPIGIVIHNTATPNLKRWHDFPRHHWMNMLENYYHNELGWSGGPHLFIDDGADGIGLFNPLNRIGVHSPSFNMQWLGFEHVGDYAVEDDDAGPGLKVKQNGIAAMAIVCAKLGIDPTTHIKLHKEDPRTDHDCPGKDMAQDKAQIIQSIIEYMGAAGDHGPDWQHVAEPPITQPGTVPQPPVYPKKMVEVPAHDTLNLRAASSAGSDVLGQLARGTIVEVLGEAMNGATKWARVRIEGVGDGWVAARFLIDPPPLPKETPKTPRADEPKVLFHTAGKMSVFGGPDDEGVSADEGLALFNSKAEMKKLLGPEFVLNTRQGLARSLNPEAFYLACRWDYDVTSKAMLQKAWAVVEAGGKRERARPADWGPNVNTGRVADLSPGLAKALGLDTDDEVTVTIYEGDHA